MSGADKELARLSKEIWGESNVPGMRDRLRDVQNDLSHLFKGLKVGLPIFIAVLLACLGWLAKSTYDLHGQVSTISGELKELPANVAQQLLRQSLQAMERGDTPAAQQALASAAAFLYDARAKQSPVKPDYFARASRQIQAMASTSQLSSGIHNIRLQLAAYRSALQSPPAPTHLTVTVHHPVAPPPTARGTTFSRATPGQIIGTPPQGLGEGIQDLTLVGKVNGVTQDLDHERWINVTFVNVKIIYRGGPVELRNVRFVNCTFDFADNQQGAKFSEYVVLNKSTFKAP